MSGDGDITDGTTPDADLQVEKVDDAVPGHDSGSREEPPRDTSEDGGLVSPGTTADGGGTVL